MRSRQLLPIMAAVTALTVASCSGGGDSGAGGTAGTPTEVSGAGAPSLHVSSPEWSANGRLRPPTACSETGDHGRSPAVSWSTGPAGTQYYAVTVMDRDADGFLHWAALNLPASTHSLDAGQHGPAKQLRNDFGYPGYGAPCPPKGSTHHYTLTVWALPAPVSSVAALRKQALATGKLTATYGHR